MTGGSGSARSRRVPVPPEDLLRKMEFEVRHRLDGIVTGDHPSRALGHGTELAQVRAYEPGDDARMIDWAVTARTDEPHVRVQIAERAITAWVLLDLSPSMAFGTADRLKHEVAMGVCLAVGHITTRRFGRVGIATFGAGRLQISPPRAGRRDLVRTLLDVAPAPDGIRPDSFGDVLGRMAKAARRRSVVVIVSDFRGPQDFKKPLQILTARHDVLAVEIVDPREDSLPPVGDVWLVDPETGRQVRADTNVRSLRERFEERAAREREQVASLIKSAGAHHIVLSTRGDWLKVFGGALAARKLM